MPSAMHRRVAAAPLDTITRLSGTKMFGFSIYLEKEEEEKEEVDGEEQEEEEEVAEWN